MQCAFQAPFDVLVVLIGVFQVIDDSSVEREIKNVARQLRPELDRGCQVAAKVAHLFGIGAEDVIVERDGRARLGQDDVIAGAQAVRLDEAAVLPKDLLGTQYLFLMPFDVALFLGDCRGVEAVAVVEIEVSGVSRRGCREHHAYPHGQRTSKNARAVCEAR